MYTRVYIIRSLLWIGSRGYIWDHDNDYIIAFLEYTFVPVSFQLEQWVYSFSLFVCFLLLSASLELNNQFLAPLALNQPWTWEPCSPICPTTQQVFCCPKVLTVLRTWQSEHIHKQILQTSFHGMDFKHRFTRLLPFTWLPCKLPQAVNMISYPCQRNEKLCCAKKAFFTWQKYSYMI